MRDVTRRDAMKILAATGAAVGCTERGGATGVHVMSETTTYGADAVTNTIPLGFQWRVRDPFLFCVHHDDRYPAGNERMGPPTAALSGRQLGSDFELRDGFRMYHGRVVPGFPQHPHRGFETVTVVRQGLLDHSDSLGAGARYGGGDVQWLTAGGGILHAEMFPLIDRVNPNPAELFQIWLNLPARRKMVDAHFSMLWHESIPRRVVRDARGRTTEVTVIAGRFDETHPLASPPASWASQEGSDVAIWTVKMNAGARITLPAAAAGTNRSLYVFRGNGVRVGGHAIDGAREVELRADRAVTVDAGGDVAEALLLQGRPIGEPVVQHGPFVMNTRDEIRQAFSDYQRTQFGGWPWPTDDNVHPRDEGRFARHADGRVERPG